MFVSTSIPGLDDVLGGGIHPGCVTEIFGKHNTGKSTLCLQIIQNYLTSNNNPQQQCLIFDTQHDIAPVLRDKLKSHEKESRANMVSIYENLRSVDDVVSILRTIQRTDGDGQSSVCEDNNNTIIGPMVVLDCLPALCETYTTPIQRSTALHKFNLFLQGFADLHNAIVVIVNCSGDTPNQNPHNNNTAAATSRYGAEFRMLGTSWAHAPSVVLHLQREVNNPQSITFHA
eukprot:PhF_6_TR38903/c0_g1_i2/m.58191